MINQNNLIIVKAKIRLRTTDEGGRKTPIKTGYRPDHVFEIYDDKIIRAYGGDIQFDDKEVITPGESKIVIVRFLRNEKIKHYIKVGQKWLIYEVPNVVAEGEIVEILTGF